VTIVSKMHANDSSDDNRGATLDPSSPPQTSSENTDQIPQFHPVHNLLTDPALVKRIHRRSRRSIFSAFLERARKTKGNTVAIIDGDGKKLTYQDLVRASFALGGPIAKHTKKNEHVGVFLPTGAGVLISCFSLMGRGRIPAMLNFTSGPANLRSAGDAAKITKVLTARKFIEIAKLEALIEDLSDRFEFIYLEDLREELGLKDKLRAIAGPHLPSLLAHQPDPEDTGVVLFTSGTEGKPKGVVLSHTNVLANIEQISAHVVLDPNDVFFNPLPAFHCYGLTAGSLWPVIQGHPVVFHPSPLQTKIIPKRIFETSSTVLFATDTFLQQYMRASDEGGMSSLRIAVCGAERVRDETRHTAETKFSFQVLEGYGVTEASPVLAANQPDDIRSGTVGKLLPTIESRLEVVEGLEGSGRLQVRGANIMKGYLSDDQPGEIKPLGNDGWYDTGDVVAIDEEGYVSIRGRLKRFAKIGGEMVSLTVVENCASSVWPDHMHAAAILPDPKKGEQVVLVTDHNVPDRAMLLRWAQSHGVPEIAVPKKIVSVEAIPVLGTGKTDFVSVTKIAKEQLQGATGEPASGPKGNKDEDHSGAKTKSSAIDNNSRQHDKEKDLGTENSLQSSREMQNASLKAETSPIQEEQTTAFDDLIDQKPTD